MKILLLGDSIRMGYDEYVKEYLKGHDVFYDNDDNGRFIDYTIWMFNLLNNQYGPFDIVHFNTGYWDMNHEGPNNEEQTPVEIYGSELRRLVKLIKETKAIPLFSLTVPLKDELFLRPTSDASNHRSNEDVIRYNEKAKEVMMQENVQIIDLYSLMMEDKDYYKCPDSLHLTVDGYKKCARKISDTILDIIK